MLRTLLAISMASAVGLAVLLVAILQEPQVSTVEIDRDRTALATEISAIRSESDKYESGLIKTLIEVRLGIARNTLAMLYRKRTSFIRRIALDYRLDGHAVHEETDQELNTILEDMLISWRKEGGQIQRRCGEIFRRGRSSDRAYDG